MRGHRGALICALVAMSLVSGCASVPPRHQDNACQLFREKPSWYGDVRRAAHDWRISEGLILAFIRQESSFVADARPPRSRVLWVIPGPRASSAYGFPQAKEGTWNDYIQATGRRFASRDDFADASDFVGWYVDRAYRVAGISKTDVYRHYLAYHEGVGGFQRGTFQAKPWLMDVARRVSQNASTFDRQLAGCRQQLQSGSWWNLFG